MNQIADIPITLKIYSQRYEYPSLNALKKIIYDRESNGLKAAFLKVGRRRLVLPETLFRLLKEQGSK